MSPVFAQAVAELGLGLALSLAREIPRADQAFRNGAEQYGLDGNRNAVLLSDLPLGIIAFAAQNRRCSRRTAPAHFTPVSWRWVSGSWRISN
ncbi:MAG: hypothetical protein ACLFSV_10605 [Alkalispirochaeta sp.]